MKSKRSTLLATAVALMATGCVHSASKDTVVASASLADAQNRPGGSASIYRLENGYALKVQPTGLAPGKYGMHLHQTGKCDAPEFSSAGAHWNPMGRKHGLANTAGPHAGDLPELVVNSGGVGTTSVNLDINLIGGNNALMDADGAAIIIHAKPDDNLTDPSGNSGARILCGVLRQKSG